MHLRDILDQAIKHQNFRAPTGTSVLRVSISGTPSHRMTNSFAGFRAEMEDILAKPLEIVGGGSGCAYICLDLGSLNPTQIDGLEDFINDPDNRQYFKNRYRITGLALTQA